MNYENCYWLSQHTMVDSFLCRTLCYWLAMTFDPSFGWMWDTTSASVTWFPWASNMTPSAHNDSIMRYAVQCMTEPRFWKSVSVNSTASILCQLEG